MEKNTNKDPLEEYVRRSFDGYEENPGTDMWARVEGDLAPSATAEPAWRVFLLRYRLRIAAVVILLLLSGLVCEHLYYQDRLRELAQQMPKTQEKRGVAAPTAPAARTPAEANDMPIAVPQSPSQARPAQPLHEPPLPSPEQMPRPRGARNMDVMLAHAAEWPSAPLYSESGIVQGHAHTSDDEYRVSQEGLVPTWAAADKFSEGKKVVERLAVLPAAPIPLPMPQFPCFSIPSPQCSIPQSPTNWYIGLHATPRRTFEDAPPPSSRPPVRPVFVSQQERPDVTTDWWLRVGRKTGRRFGVESGIGFSENTRTGVHAARFRFADGATVPGSTQRRNFSYDLSTYGGSAAVELRMEPANPSAPLADAEPVVVRVWTTERMQLLRVPMLLTYHAGAGRVQAVAKAGLVANFFLKNDLNVTARASQNSRLRFAQGIANSIAYERTDNFFLGYWASAGAAFRWNRRLSIVAEPAISGNFARRDAQGHRLPDHLLVGVNFGVHWAVGK